MQYQTALLTGRITIGGLAAPHIEVTLLPDSDRIKAKAVATTKTAEDGRYRFAELPSGYYWLEVNAPGYINSLNGAEEDPGRIVSVPEGRSVENADLDLTLGGVISGRITDTEGNSVAGELVELTFAVDQDLEGQTLDLYVEEDELKTDRNGEYRIYGIPPGRYLVSVGVDIARMNGAAKDRYDGRVDKNHYFEQTFYPGATDRQRAKVIDICAGTDVAGLNIRLGRAFPAYTLSGRVIDANSGEAIRQAYIQLGHYITAGSTSSYSLSDRRDTDQDGNFRVEGLLPGRFFVIAHFDPGTEYYCDRVEFEVTRDNINGLVIGAHRGLTISGSVVVVGINAEAGMEELPQLILRTAPGGSRVGAGDFREAAVNSDGSFTIRGLRPGLLGLLLGYQRTSKYFSMVGIQYAGPSGVTETKPSFELSLPGNAAPLTLGETGLEGVRVLLSYRNGSIKGNVSINRGSVDSNTRLDVWITEKCFGSTSFEVDVNRNFFIDGLEPGVYGLKIVGDNGIRSETKNVVVERDSETSVEFMIDLPATEETD